MVYGVYDIVAKVNGESMDKLKYIITEHIRRIDKVRTTLTMMVSNQNSSFVRVLLTFWSARSTI
jgi:DNA-binding Lrp family transcriptional regulator